MKQSTSKSKQIKVMMPSHLYVALAQEAKNAAVTMADLVRLAVAERYKNSSTHVNITEQNPAGEA
jgi:hypothetical protein